MVAFLLDLDLSINELNELKTVLSEAVTNAIIHGYDEDSSKEVEVKIAYDEYDIFLTVNDYGKGIEDIDKAKEPLYTTKLAEERAGLGFTIMSVFSDELIVDSKIGYGTSILMKKAYGKS
jgi:stage II sporulation protein AB (anti-sigma F factor)